MNLSKGFALVILSMVLLSALFGCSENSEPSADTDSASNFSNDVASPDGDVELENIPRRDFTGTDVCTVLSGVLVADTVNMDLVETSSDTDIPSCTYSVRGESPVEETIYVSLLGNMGAFSIGRVTATNVENLTGIGLDAYLNTLPGGSFMATVVRDDGMYFSANAKDRETVMAIARLVVDTIPRP